MSATPAKTAMKQEHVTKSGISIEACICRTQRSIKQASSLPCNVVRQCICIAGESGQACKDHPDQITVYNSWGNGDYARQPA